MKFKTLFSLTAIAALLAIGFTAQAQFAPIPTSIVPTSAPAFNTNGLSFTNVTWKAEVGTKFGASGGTLAYVQGDVDIFKNVGGAVDIGLEIAGSPSTSGSGFHDTEIGLMLMKNLSNWQLCGILAYDRQFVDDGSSTVGNYYSAGVGANYNLTAGTGINILGFAIKGQQYVGFRIDWEGQTFNIASGAANVSKDVRIYTGFTF